MMSYLLAEELLEDVENDQQLEEGQSQQNSTQNDADGWGEMQDDEEMKESIEDDLAGLNDEQEKEEGGGGGGGEGGEGIQESILTIANGQEGETQYENVDRIDFRLENVRSIYAICTLMQSQRMKDALTNIQKFSALPEPDVEGILEDSPEYKLIVHANNLAVEVDNESFIAHKFIRHLYKSRFPELESLIANPWEFVQAVRAIGNQNTIANEKLNEILPHGLVVVISMQASTTKGRKLDAEAWKKVEEACDLMLDLERAKSSILRYVESRMGMIAPNLSNIVGSQVATKLLGIAGGLTSLIKIPACNLMLLGTISKQSPGLSSSSLGKRNGVILQSPLIQAIPPEYHRQALRIVSAKALLAARVDAGRSDLYGTYGARLRMELEKKLEKLQEPPPAKMIKALPIPKEGGKKARRGGRKARKFKERNGMSELRKVQNRIRFGEAEEEVGAFDESEGMGMLNSKSKGDDGQLRALIANRNTEARMSKRNFERVQALRQSAGSSKRLDDYFSEHINYKDGSMLEQINERRDDHSSGTATTLTVTPVQGIELSDPSRQTKVQEANAKWFKEGSFSLKPDVSRSQILPNEAERIPVNFKKQKRG